MVPGHAAEAIVQCVKDHGCWASDSWVIPLSSITLGGDLANHDATRFLFSLSREVMG